MGGVVEHVILLAAAPGLIALDVNAYAAAADRLVSSGSPYAVDLYAGPIEHVPANVGIGYLYPPPIAQLFVAFRALPLSIVGALILQVLTTLLTVMRMPEGARDILFGAIILVVTAIYLRIIEDR